MNKTAMVPTGLAALIKAKRVRKIASGLPGVQPGRG